MSEVILLTLNWRGTKEMGAMQESAMALPLEFVYISNGLIRKGIDHQFIDSWLKNKKIRHYKKKISQAKIIVINSAPSYLFWRDGITNIGLVKRSAKAIKEINKKIILILIGPHGTVRPESFNNSQIDFIIRGEPDLITPELIKRIMNGDSIKDLEGVSPSKKGTFYKITPPQQVSDLNDLPILSYDKFKIKDYRYPPPRSKLPRGKFQALYESSRGCPYKCIYCFKYGFRNRFRLKSLTVVDQELKRLKALGASYLYLIDEIFFLKEKWSIEVIKLLKKYDFTWGCQTRPSLLTSEIVENLCRFENCRLIQIGLEHTDGHILSKIGKSETQVDQLARELWRLTVHDIDIELFIVTGLPSDSPKKLMAMEKIFSKFPLHKIKTIIHPAMPFPGTPLWQLGLQKGYKLKDWDDVNTYAGLICSNFKSKRELQKESFRLAGTIKKLTDKARIEYSKRRRKRVKMTDRIKLIKHSLDKQIPSIMIYVTRLLLFLRKRL